MTQIKVFVINLDRSPERLALISSHLKQARLAFERVPALDGNSLSLTEIKNLTNSFNQWWYTVPLSPSEIGIALSHKRVYEIMIERNLPEAIIMEDDCQFDGRLTEFLELKQPELGRWDFFSFWLDKSIVDKQCQKFSSAVLRGSTFDLYDTDELTPRAHGYFCSLAFAQARLKDLIRILEPVDRARFSGFKWRTGGVFPALCNYEGDSVAKRFTTLPRRDLVRMIIRDPRIAFQAKVLSSLATYVLVQLIHGFYKFRRKETRS